jgi:hypothetical protein
MADEGFKLPASSYEELTKIIMGYGKSKDPVGPGDISRLTGQNEDQVSKNNPFLVSIGVVQGGKKKIATDTGYALARALEHEMPDEIVKNWRSIVLANDFFQKTLSAIKIRKGMDFPTLQAHVAYSAGQPKNPKVMAGAKAVIDILRAAGLITEQDGKYTIISEGVSTSEREGVSDENPPSELPTQGTKLHKQPITLSQSVPETGMVGISIQIQIHCSAGEIDGLGVQLRQLLKDLAEAGQQEMLPKEESDSREDINGDTQSESQTREPAD